MLTREDIDNCTTVKDVLYRHFKVSNDKELIKLLRDGNDELNRWCKQYNVDSNFIITTIKKSLNDVPVMQFNGEDGTDYFECDLMVRGLILNLQ